MTKEYFRHDSKYTRTDMDRITHVPDGHPGDPLNIAIAGTEKQLICAMVAASWFPADPITFRTSVVRDGHIRQQRGIEPYNGPDYTSHRSKLG